MGRRKLSINIFPMREGFDGFTKADVEQLEGALGQSISDELKSDLEGEISGWLTRYDGYRALDWGDAERKVSKRAEKAVKQLAEALRQLGPIATIALDHFAYRHKVENAAFISVLDDLCEMTEYLERVSGPAPNAAATQIQALSFALQDRGINVTATNPNYATSFKPSPFVRFIGALWEIEPRLRLYSPTSANEWTGLSQWIGERLREEPNPLKLLQHPKLK